MVIVIGTFGGLGAAHYNVPGGAVVGAMLASGVVAILLPVGSTSCCHWYGLSCQQAWSGRFWYCTFWLFSGRNDWHGYHGSSRRAARGNRRIFSSCEDLHTLFDSPTPG